MLHVQCRRCGAWALTQDGTNPDAALSCGCCPEDHDHAAAANACPGAGQGHDGTPCGPEADGCTVCRPVTITLMPGSVTAPALVMGG